MSDNDNEQTRAWLTLIRTPSFGGVRVRELIARFGNVAAALDACVRTPSKLEISAAAQAWLGQPDHARIDADLQWLQGEKRHLLTCTDADFPPLLSNIDNPPAALFCEGDTSLLWRPQLAIVGSRSASAGGLAIAKDFSRTLAAQGLVINSGLADGIDAAAHSAALDVGGGTIGVTGTGLDVIYPKRNTALTLRMRDQALVVTEFPLGTAAKADHFPRRNRIISGLSLGVLVVEAGLNSGSLITARLAAEQGREVFAIPGSIHNPMARGCHRLIRQGAKLIETAQDVLDELGPMAQQLGLALRQRLDQDETVQNKSATPKRDADYLKLIDVLGYDPVSIDELIARSGFSAQVLSSMLLVLELDGEVAAMPGALYMRQKSN